PAPDFDIADEDYEAPEGDDETAVAQVFADVLGLGRVGVTTSFFNLGGNSLSAMRLAARTGEVLETTVSVRDLFDAPTVRELVAAVGAGDKLAPITKADPRPEHIPVSFAQQRMWFMNQFDPDAPTYNIQAGVRLRGELDIEALRQAVLDVIERHEVLRTTFPGVDGEPTQVIHDLEWAGDNLDWAIVDSEAGLLHAATRGFVVSEQSAFRVRLLRSAPGEWIFLAVLHHIVSDGESMGPLLTDIVTAYVARAHGQAPAFAPLPIQFADYAIWQHDVLGDPQDAESVVGGQLEYWTDQLMGLPDVLELPADRPRPVTASASGASIDFAVPQGVAERIERLAAEYGLTSFMVVHAALAVLLSRLTAADDIAIATPIAGRGEKVLDPMVGMFVNTLVLRSELEPMMAFSELLEEVRETDLDAFANADVPFEAVVDAVGAVRSQAFAPLAQVMLSVDHSPGDGAATGRPAVDVGALTVEQIEPPTAFAQRDLSITVRTVAGRDWPAGMVYATDLFNEATMVTFAQRFLTLLDSLTDDPDGAIGAAQFLVAQEHSSLVDWSSGQSTAPVPGDGGGVPGVAHSGDRANGNDGVSDN
ncbi:putative non-ribosomal peptide synthetase, partial [Gordonia amarae NBRC 15530]